MLQVLKVVLNKQEKRTRLKSVFFLTLEKRIIRGAQVDLGLNEGVTEQ